ncbi:hypothetical protein AB0B30_08070 [Streptomyces narbonensis]|uniref:DUF4333 domain-containing protein n=1 Tax=Streptomyces narbonensis TaxID=67333 RepID=A0ABV3C7K8_9ACTN
MATVGNGKPQRPRRRTWIWVSVLATFFCGGPLAFLVWGAMVWDDIGKEKPYDCAEAMAFARGRLPAGAEDARCTERHFQDSFVTADFRMPRAEVAPWLAATYPTGTTEPTCKQDLCVDVSYDQLLYVDVQVTYEDGDTALVRVEAFDM